MLITKSNKKNYYRRRCLVPNSMQNIKYEFIEQKTPKIENHRNNLFFICQRIRKLS